MFKNQLDPRTPTLIHLEPTNLRMDFTLPLRKRGSLTLGAEAGPWLMGVDQEFELVPGARATIRVIF